MAVVCGLAALGGFLYVLFSGISTLTDGLLQADMPGQQTLNLHEAGTYTVFYEWTHPYPSNLAVGGDGDARAMQLTLLDSENQEVPLNPNGGNSTYQLGPREGYSVYTFQLQQPGPYTLTGAYEDGSEARVMYTIANNFMGKILKIVAMCFVALGVPGLLGFLFLIFAFKPLFSKKSEG
jgi:hypothetical protein